MPFAVLKSIREVSSEDKLHCASNLLKNDPARKWKTEKGGEKSAYVIIEMEQAYSIKGIDIGNESSAFVEVLVGGPTCARENFKEILITCSFMTPNESKTSTSTHRVRCFNREALVKEIVDEKWKLLKIICTQPFNRNVQYGLSFIKIHVDGPPPDKKKNGPPSSNLAVRTSSSFTLREDSPDSESESTTALFNRWKQSRNKDTNGISSVPRIATPASIKKPNENILRKVVATSSPSVERTDPKENVRDRNRDSLLFIDEDEDVIKNKRKDRLEKLARVIVADQERVTKETTKTKKPKKHDSSRDESKSVDHKQKTDEAKSSDRTESKTIPLKKSPTNVSKPSTPSTSRHRRPSSSPCTSDKAKKPKLDKFLQYRPFDQLLRGVVLVISGIQNPDRSDLRKKALALGAKYKVDWDSNCTHLICAFKNTPKYNQVKGVGKIITRSWVEDCHSQKKRLPWRRYALDAAELSKPESEDEILDDSLKPKESKSTSRKDSIDDDDLLEAYDKAASYSHLISSGSDTEDEIQKVLASTSPRKKAPQTIDIFEVSTEEEDYVSKRNGNGSPKTLTFFKGLKFFVSDLLSATEKIKVERHIETFHGFLTKSPEDANYVIANEANREFKGETVKPLWILECNDGECWIPTKRYLVT